MITQISTSGVAFVAGWEGGRSPDGLYRAYLDRVANPHVWTIGIGETEDVHQGMVWTAVQAARDFNRRLAGEYIPAILALPVAKFLNQNEFDMLCSIIWNCGPGILETGHTLGDALRRGDMKAAAEAFLIYNRAGGVVVQGLVNRRAAEKARFETPVAKPDPYWRFDRTDVVVSGRHEKHVRHANEYETAGEYDRLMNHAKLHPVRLKRLRANCDKLADRVESNEREKHDPHGTHYHRLYRLDQLSARAKGWKVKP